MPQKNSQRLLQPHIQVIYDAVLEEDGWNGLISHLTNELEFRSGLISMEGLDGSGIIKRYSVGYTDQENQALKEHFHCMDVWTQALREQPTGRAWSSDYLVPMRQLQKTEFYNDFCRNADMSHSTGAFIKTDKQLALKIAFQHRHEQGEIGDKEAYLQNLLPHLSRATELKQTLSDFQCSLNSTMDIIDTFPIAALLLDENANIHYANAFAEKIFAEHSLIACKQQFLIIRGNQQQNIFLTMLQNAVSAVAGNAVTEHGNILFIPGLHPEADLEIQVQPIGASDSMFGMAVRKPLALVFIKEVNSQAPLNQEILQSLFKLSQRETELAILLVQGNTLSEIAFQKHRSLNTLKTQLKSLFSKTSTNSQSQLVARLLSSLAAVKI